MALSTLVTRLMLVILLLSGTLHLLAQKEAVC